MAGGSTDEVPRRDRRLASEHDAMSKPRSATRERPRRDGASRTARAPAPPAELDPARPAVAPPVDAARRVSPPPASSAPPAPQREVSPRDDSRSSGAADSPAKAQDARRPRQAIGVTLEDSGRRRDAYRRLQLADAVRIAAGLSIAAGAIHAIAMVDHFDHYWLFGVFFLLLTYFQVLWGVARLRGRGSERALRLGALANLAIVAVWLFSRTIGVPLGPEAGEADPVGTMDVAATIDELLLVAYVAVILRPSLRDGRGFRMLVGRHRMRLAIMVCSATVFTALIGGHQH